MNTRAIEEISRYLDSPTAAALLDEIGDEYEGVLKLLPSCRRPASPKSERKTCLGT